MSTTKTRLAVAASVALNVVLLVILAFAYLAAPAGQSRGATSTGVFSPVTDRRADANDTRTPDNYFAHLRSRGLTIDETKPLLLSRLEAEFLSGARGMFEEKYWDAGMNEDYLKAEIELANAQEKIRAALIDVYGPKAEHDPAFQRAFRPLDPRLAVLTSAQQIAYQKYRLQRQLAATTNVKSGLRPAGQQPPVGLGATVLDHRSTVEELNRFLEPEAVAEVLYRYSPLAEQVRSAGVALTETEFRETFRSLEQLEISRSPATYVETRDSLRRLLGADRFARVWAVRDPTYAALAAAGAELGLTEATTFAAYQIVNDAQELMAEVVRLQYTDPERAKTRMREATVAQRERLSGLVGPEAAERLLHSLRLAARDIARQSVERGSVPLGSPTRAGQMNPIVREAPQ